MVDSQPSYLDRLKETILRTGFPLELEVDEVLQNKGWFTSPNMMYIDYDLNPPMQRETDNQALSPLQNNLDKRHHPIPVSLNLFVECKKLPATFAVVMSRKRTFVTHYDFSGQIIDLGFYPVNEGSALDLFFDGFDFHYKQMAESIGFGREIAIGKIDASKDREAKDMVFTGSMQLVKAQAYNVSRIIEMQKSTPHSHYPLFFTFLALIIEGKVIEAEFRGGELEAKEVDHAIMKVSYKPSYLNEPKGYLIDVISKDYLRRYLDLLVNDIAALSAETEKRKDFLLRYLEKARPPPPVL